jgi:hypothetical protein
LRAFHHKTEGVTYRDGAVTGSQVASLDEAMAAAVASIERLRGAAAELALACGLRLAA